MRIIAATKYEFIVQMSPSELRMLSARSSVPDVRNSELVYHVGKEFRVDEAYHRLRSLNENRAALDRIVGQFKAMGELLGPVVTEVEQETNPKEGDE
jgi:hypothetical protein